MKFCPECDVRLVRRGSGLECPRCGHASADEARPKPPEKPAAPSTFNVLDESEANAAQSTIKKECEKCGNDEAVWWMLQTRSADEPTTQFYRCTKCSYTWRDYS